MLVSPLDHLLHSGNEIFRADGFRRWRGGARMAEIVDSLEYNHVLDARLSQHVPIEPCERADPKSHVRAGVVQNPVSADSGIDDPNFPAAVLGQQAGRQSIRPSMIGI